MGMILAMRRTTSFDRLMHVSTSPLHRAKLFPHSAPAMQSSAPAIPNIGVLRNTVGQGKASGEASQCTHQSSILDLSSRHGKHLAIATIKASGRKKGTGTEARNRHSTTRG